jgi:hypothetical protein
MLQCNLLPCIKKKEIEMSHLKLFTAAAVLTTMIASPVMANDYYNRAPRGSYVEHRADSGFWPADAAAGIVGGAIGTAGAIAAAPFEGPRGHRYDDTYAYYDQPAYGAPYRGGYVYRSDSLSRTGSGESASFGAHGGGTRSPAADGDIGN